MNKETIRATSGWVIVGLLGGLLIAWLFFGSESETPVAENHAHEAGTVYTCSMHPQIRQPEPGLCPLCGMELIPVAEGDEGSETNFQLTDYAKTLAGVETIRVGSSTGTDNTSGNLQLSGQLQVAESNLFNQVAHIPGRIEQLFVNTTGESVRQGQALASIYSPELLAAQQELIQATKLSGSYAGLLEAAREKLRQFRISNSQIQRIEKEGRTFDRLTIVADANGVVTDLMVTQGAYVNPGQPLMQIARLNTLWAELEAYENQLSSLKVGQPLQLKVNATGKTYPAEITFINPILNGNSRTVEVRAEVSNANSELKPQMLVQAEVNIENFSAPSSEIIIPRSAVLWTGERSVVYVQDTDGSYRMREVEVQPSGAGYRVVNGLSNGEQVVVNGTFVVDAAAQLQNKPSMMNRALKASTAAPAQSMKMESPKFEGNDQFKKALDKTISAYLQLKNALVNGKDKEAQTASQLLEKTATNLDVQKLSAEAQSFVQDKIKQLQTGAKAIQDAKNLDQQRSHFIGLSEGMLALAEAFPNKGQTLYRQYCPMANNDVGAYWLSSDKEIKNPYYGDMMLNCGEVVNEF